MYKPYKQSLSAAPEKRVNCQKPPKAAGNPGRAAGLRPLCKTDKGFFTKIS